ncbi:hypothetical protein [Spirillospora sp. NPDC047279]|uniref:hypothetical protein n=1 Tax=Spirillospora sp. NPDC047279 TaxID=3155478 RepID=UPI0033E592D8
MSSSSPPVSVARPPAHPTRRGPLRTERLHRRWGLLLLLGWLVQVAVRLWFAAGQNVPIATPDETGYLFAARVLTGGPDADLSFGTVYRGGYPLLILPAFWLSEDPETVHQIALVVNALISALTLPLAYGLLRRLAMSRRRSYAIATATALLPAVVFYSEFVLTDAVMPVLVLAWLLLAHSWLVSKASPLRVTAYGSGAGVIAAYAYSCHTRGLIVLLVHGGLLAVAAVARWRPRWSIAVAAAATAATAGAGMLLNRALLPHLYPDGDNHLSANVAERLTSLDGWGWTLGLGTGQAWYQIVATGGLAGIGLIAVIAAAVRRGTPGRVRVLAIALVAAWAGIALASSAALPDENRIGNYVYGRYLACLTPVFFALGAAVLLKASRRTAVIASATVAAAAVVLAVIVDLYAGDRLSHYEFTLYDFPESAFLTWDWESFHLWRATLAGLAILGLCLGAALLPKQPRHRTALLTGFLAAVQLAAVTASITQIARPLAREITANADIRDVIKADTRPAVAIDWNIPWKLRMQQVHWIWWTEIEIFDSRWVQPPVGVDRVLMVWPEGRPPAASWPKAPAGWKVVQSRRGPEGDWVAWSID